MEAVAYLAADGDTLVNLASRQQETVCALRLSLLVPWFEPGEPLPVGARCCCLRGGTWVA